jgi:hypothetical protein
VAQPRTWTELFFLDEAVALAAGHRPCAYCRRKEYNEFKALWGGALAVEMDRTLHAERLDGRQKRLHTVSARTLPDGAFIHHAGLAHLVTGAGLLPYTQKGYGPPVSRPAGDVPALTPPSILRVLSGGYTPLLHLSVAPLMPR